MLNNKIWSAEDFLKKEGYIIGNDQAIDHLIDHVNNLYDQTRRLRTGMIVVEIILILYAGCDITKRVIGDRKK